MTVSHQNVMVMIPSHEHEGRHLGPWISLCCLLKKGTDVLPCPVFSVLDEPMPASAIMLGGVQSYLVPSWRVCMGRTTSPDVSCGIGPDEIFQVNSLAV